jgi:pimeloyl-ACP methyl ester carboxylesterase
LRLSSSDAALEYEILGEGPPLILLHAFPANHEMWLPVAQGLATRYRCILPDLRGHGNSEPGSGAATMQKYADDLERLCRELNVERAVFAGISIGGYILFEFWRQRRERFAGIVLADTRAGEDSEGARNGRMQSIEDVQKRGPDPFLDTMAGKLLGTTTRRNRPDRVAAARAMMAKMTIAGISAVQRGMAQRPDSTATIKTINVPTLILVGDEDVVTPVSEAELMRSHIPGAQLQVIPHAGHFAIFEQPELATGILRQFLGSLRW